MEAGTARALARVSFCGLPRDVPGGRCDVYELSWNMTVITAIAAYTRKQAACSVEDDIRNGDTEAGDTLSKRSGCSRHNYESRREVASGGGIYEPSVAEALRVRYKRDMTRLRIKSVFTSTHRQTADEGGDDCCVLDWGERGRGNCGWDVGPAQLLAYICTRRDDSVP